METLKVYCGNLGRYIDIKGGETLSDIYGKVRDEIGFDPICARVNNKTEDMSFPVFSPKYVEFLRAGSASGTRVCVRSLCMLLYVAVYRTMPEAVLRIEHSICRGYYCRLLDKESKKPFPISEELLENLRAAMRSLCDRRLPFERKERLTKDVIKRFRSQGLDDKVALLETTHQLYTVFYTLDGVSDSYYGPLAPDTGMVSVFGLIKYKEGFLLMPPDTENPLVPRKSIDQEKMFDVFTRYQQFNRVIRVSDVADVNRTVERRETGDLINVAETMHGNYISRISDQIASLHAEGKGRIVLIAGPSSSGKTTFCKRLGIQLMTNLLSPKMISLDDYFVDRERTPRDETGDYDYESLYALDLERLNADLEGLLAGKTVYLPSYSFELGKRTERERPITLDDDEVLIMEGIHGLNPALVPGLPADKIFKIYVSALTTLRIDDHNWISTTDNRLLRRIVRDFRYRHTSALDTIRRWPSVRRGEEKWIFPFQENADATFNSSLIFEIGAMRSYAEPILHQVPHDVPQYSEANRLLQFLSYFEPIPTDQIPSTSLLREFLGGSLFHY